jgi:hypothetical protein
MRGAMSVLGNEWVWDELNDYVEAGFISEKEASEMSFEKAYEFITNYSNRNEMEHVRKYGVTTYEAKQEMIQESYRW